MNAATLSGPNASTSMTPAMRASRMLGWLSFAIGAAELIAPRKVAQAVGMNENHTGLLRAYGAREMLAGVGSHSVYPVPALWSRVAGDVLDIATVALAAERDEDGNRSRNNWIAIAALTGVTMIDAMVASRLAAETKEGKSTTGERKDYSDRSGFPGGVQAARGAGIVREAMAGKAGGAAAGDSSPAGQSDTGRSQTDLTGGPAATQRESGPATREGQGESSSGGSASQQGGFIGGGSEGKMGQTMSQDAQSAIPEPPSYTPA